MGTSLIPMGPSEQLELRDLLIRIFDEHELRRFLRYGPYREILVAIPGEGTPLAKQIDATIDALTRRGSIDDRFFERLKGERQHQKPEIEAVEKRWRLAGGGQELVQRDGSSPQDPPNTKPHDVPPTAPAPNARPFALAAATLVVLEAWVWFDDRPGAFSQRTGKDFLLLAGVTIAFVVSVFAVVRWWRGRRTNR